MKLIGTISIVTTKPKNYTYYRKGYYVGQRWVKPRKIRKCKYVPTKPYLFGNLNLQINQALSVGGVYKDDYGRDWLCVNTIFASGGESILKIVDPYLGKSFNNPCSLTLVSKLIKE